MRRIFIAAAVSIGCLAPVAETNSAPPPAPAEVFLSWIVSPGTFASGTWTIPGTTTITPSVLDVNGDPITVGQLVWETCTGSGLDLAHHPAADCLQRGPVRWRAAVIIDPADITPISPCFCAGAQQGFRLVYRAHRKSGFQSDVGDPFDLLATLNCPTRTDCP
jgi:hypothetical protein